MANKTKSVLISDIKVKGNITEKESIIIDGKLTEILMQSLLKPLKIQILKETSHQKMYLIGGKLKGDINSDKVHISKTADVDGTIKQKSIVDRRRFSFKN